MFSAALFVRFLAGTLCFILVRNEVPGARVIFIACVVVAGSAFGGAFTIKCSMTSDVTDLEQARAHGLRDEGKIIAFFDVSSKAMAGTLLAFALWMVDVSGYVADVVPQNVETQNAIR